MVEFYSPSFHWGCKKGKIAEKLEEKRSDPSTSGDLVGKGWGKIQLFKTTESDLRRMFAGIGCA